MDNTGFNAEDEWVLVPDNPELRIRVNWDKKELLGAEYKGIYHKPESFTDEIRAEIKKFIKITPLPFHHFDITCLEKNKGG